MGPWWGRRGEVLVFYKVISRNFDSYSCMNICRVDEFGGHVTGEGHYGFCSTDCLDSEGLIKTSIFLIGLSLSFRRGGGKRACDFY